MIKISCFIVFKVGSVFLVVVEQCVLVSEKLNRLNSPAATHVKCLYAAAPHLYNVSDAEAHTM